jgi:diaminopimelate epimerase
MTKIKFFKYQGAGNDFIIIDNRTLQFKVNNIGLIAHLCNRRFGIGADGLLLLQSSDNADFEMLYYNADGKPGSMCGNGGRCMVAFARKLGIIEDEAHFKAMDGFHYASLNQSGNWVSLQMIDVDAIENDDDNYVLNTGSPHYVKLVDNLKDFDVYANGKAIRNNTKYEQTGINVNFVQSENNGYFVRTYERGVEDETLACGTGVTAVAIAMAKKNNLLGDIVIPIRVLGGSLSIRMHAEVNKFTNVFLEGPAVFVYEGTINLSKKHP